MVLALDPVVTVTLTQGAFIDNLAGGKDMRGSGHKAVMMYTTVGTTPIGAMIQSIEDRGRVARLMITIKTREISMNRAPGRARDRWQR